MGDKTHTNLADAMTDVIPLSCNRIRALLIAIDRQIDECGNSCPARKTCEMKMAFLGKLLEDKDIQKRALEFFTDNIKKDTKKKGKK